MNSELPRLLTISPDGIAAKVTLAKERFDKVVAITLRELGPVVKLFSTVALVEGETEVVLQVAEHVPPADSPTQTFTVHWQNGGPGVIKDVASLPQDMETALLMGLAPSKP